MSVRETFIRARKRFRKSFCMDRICPTPGGNFAHVNERKIMINVQQIELSLPANTNPCPRNRRVRRAPNASWWFARMHQVVDEAAASVRNATGQMPPPVELGVGARR